MAKDPHRELHPIWWTAVLFAFIIGLLITTSMFFSGTFRSYVPVTLTSDRAGLVMESGGKVKMRGVEVGRVAAIKGGNRSTSLQLEIDPDQIRFIPSNVRAQIMATTAFGAKYVDFLYPDDPSPRSLSAGAVLQSSNVSTEVNTVFENLMNVTKQIDPAKLNAVLSAVAEGVRGKGEAIGLATTDSNQVLLALNARSDMIGENWRSLKGYSDAYTAAADDIVRILSAATTTSATLTEHASSLDALLLNTIGFSQAGINLLAPNQENLVNAVNIMQPTTGLLYKYNPVYTCMLMGAKWLLDNGLAEGVGGNGRTSVIDAGLRFGSNLYRYPDHLPIIAAKGGPGGKPSCGSLPDASKQYPVRQLVTNTGWGTGLDIRPNPGIGSPCYANFLPVTRAVPEPPSIRQCLPGPAPGPMPYPGAPPYGAPLYGPGGTPLWPGVPPPEPAPEAPAAPPTDAPSP